MRRITTLLFDLGNVITGPQDRGYVNIMRELMGGDSAPERFAHCYRAVRDDYDRGLIDHRQYWRKVGACLDLVVSEEKLDALRDADLKSWFNINEEMVAFLRELRGRARHLLLVSNLHWDGADYLERTFAWKDLFDSRIYSCEHKVNKPQAEIFRIALAQVGAKPDASLFVDDLEENVEGGRKAGLQALLFTDLPRLKRELQTAYRISS